MTRKSFLLATSLLAAAMALPAVASAESIPSVVVTLENVQPSRGTFLTPIWIGIHDGTFDSYDGGSPASVPLGGNEIESLAEDGNNGPITETFDTLTAGAPQASGVAGPGGPLAPGDRASVTLNVDPAIDRYFSYASMIIPSNDFFIANGNPLAHELFDANGTFVGESFIVSGDETNDAGTEVNNEIASDVAFLNQAAPNTGPDEGAPVVTPAPGFAAPGTLAYPNGVLNHPVFGNGDFNDADDRVLKVSFRFVDLGGDNVRFRSALSPDQEVQPDPVDSEGRGNARTTARNGEEVRVRISFNRLSGPLTMAHLHLGAAGTNGPVVVDMGSAIRNRSVNFTVTAGDLTGPLAGQDLVALLNELAAGNIYVNLHTAEFPAGELRGQLELVQRRNGQNDNDDDDDDEDDDD
ncbi:MAG: spondin domain-containing protein [Pseudomonadota bacterium]